MFERTDWDTLPNLPVASWEPTPEPPKLNTPCYYCGAQATIWRHGTPQCTPGHKKGIK